MREDICDICQTNSYVEYIEKNPTNLQGKGIPLNRKMDKRHEQSLQKDI